MKSTRRPLALAVTGAVLALASGAAAVSASLGATTGRGLFPVRVHEGMAPGTVPALLALLGLVLVGVGAAVHDGRSLSASAVRPVRAVRPARPAVVSGPVHVITTLPPRVTPPRQGRATRPAPHAPRRRTSTGKPLVLVGTTRR